MGENSSDSGLILFPHVGAAAAFRVLLADGLAAAGTLVGVASRRTPEDFLLRVATHEGGHVVTGLAMGSKIGGVTIVPGNNYCGMTWGPTGDPPKYCSADEVNLCTRIAPLMPPIGEARSDCAEVITHAHSRVVELLGGTEAERLLYLDAPPLSAEHDLIEARNFAEIICRTAGAVDSFISFARAEASNLIIEYRSAVIAVAAALVERKTLLGDEIDQIITAALAQDELAVEKKRRDLWAATVANAAAFEASHG